MCKDSNLKWQSQGVDWLGCIDVSLILSVYTTVDRLQQNREYFHLRPR